MSGAIKIGFEFLGGMFFFCHLRQLPRLEKKAAYINMGGGEKRREVQI